MAWGTAFENRKGPSYGVLPSQHSPEFDEVVQSSAEVVVSAENQTLMESSQMEEMGNKNMRMPKENNETKIVNHLST